MHHCLRNGTYVSLISSLCVSIPSQPPELCQNRPVCANVFRNYNHSLARKQEARHTLHPIRFDFVKYKTILRWIYAYINCLSIITFCFLSLFRSQLPVECVVTPRNLCHDKLLCGHPVHFHLSIWYQALPWRSWHLVLWTALPPTFPSCRLQDTHGCRAWELQGPHRALGWLAAEELHPAHQQHRGRALREILFSCWPRRSEHVHLPWLFWVEGSG